MLLRTAASWLAWATCCLVAAAAAQPVLLVKDGQAEGDYTTYVRTSTVHRALRRAGLEHDIVPAPDLGFRAYQDQQLAVLPANPNLADREAAWLRRFVERGGRLLVCPPLPESLADLLGIRSSDQPRTGRTLEIDSIRFDRSLVPGFPSAWEQFDWVIQPIRITGASKRVASWETTDQGFEATPAVTCGSGGAFVAAVLEGDDRLAEAQIMLALATTYFPTLWHRAIPRLLSDVGQLGDVPSLSRLRQVVSEAPLPSDRKRAAMTEVDRAVLTIQEARRRYELALREGSGKTRQPVTSTPAERYVPLAEMGFQAGQHAEQAYYLAQESRPDEFVGVWMQQFGDLREWSWERIANALADHRVDALFINAVNGGYANYPSQILPHITAEGDDVIRDALAACRKVGIECHVWMMVNYVRPLTPDKFRRELLDEGRFEQSLSGGTLPFLRPSLPENVAQVTAVAREIASRYDIDGLHLDYIRYSPDGDYSDHERELFEAHLRQPLEDWPRDVQLGGRQRLAWCAWRRDNVDRQVESIVDAAREARPRIKLSAAVYPIWTDAYYKVGQAPAEWARRGWVDFLCPMNYQTNDTTFYRYLKVQQRDAGNAVPLYPGIAAWRQESPADTISQIRRLRAENAAGYVMFHLDRRMLREWLPALSRGITAPDTYLGPATPWLEPVGR